MTDALQNALGLLDTGPVSTLYREQGETSYYNRTVRELKASIADAPRVLEALETLAECAADITPNEARRRFFTYPFINALDAARSIIKATKGE